MYYSFLHIRAIGRILQIHENLHFSLNPNFVEYRPFLVETRNTFKHFFDNLIIFVLVAATGIFQVLGIDG